MHNFSVRDLVMIKARSEKIPSESIEILHTRCIGLCKILLEIGLNTYKLDIPLDLDTSPVSIASTWLSIIL